MKRMLIRGIQIGLLASTLAVMETGCVSSTSTKSHAPKPEVGACVDLSKYQTATVLPFPPDTNTNIDVSIGVKFAEEVAHRLQYDFGPIFKEVRKGPPLGKEDELIVTGTIHEYNARYPFVRAITACMDAAHFEGDLILKDGADNRILFSAPFRKLRAGGGILGAIEGIEERFVESEAAVALTIAKAKGWKPPTKASKAK